MKLIKSALFIFVIISIVLNVPLFGATQEPEHAAATEAAEVMTPEPAAPEYAAAPEADYYESASIVAIEGDTVTVNTDSGALLAFVGSGYEVGDSVELHMSINDIADPQDDSVLDAVLL